jgi:hypothetical protein
MRKTSDGVALGDAAGDEETLLQVITAAKLPAHKAWIAYEALARLATRGDGVALPDGGVTDAG